MHVVRTQLFSLIICSSEVESTHLRGVEKSLALFISQQLREDALEAAFALENGGFHTCVGLIKDLALGNAGFCAWAATGGKAQVRGHVLEDVGEPKSENHPENRVSILLF